jgi:hypothetical protein
VSKQCLIASLPRCGNQMLRSILNQHKKIHAVSEVLRLSWLKEREQSNHWDKQHVLKRLNISSQEDVIDNFNLIKSSCNKDVFCYTVFPSQLLDSTLLGHIQYDKCIFLVRSNMLKRFCSIKLGSIVKRWEADQESFELKKNITFKLDLDEYINYALTYRNNVNKIKSTLSKHILLNYEDIINKTSDIFSYLDVPYIEVTPTTKQTEQRSLNEVIHNYDDVINTLESQNLIYLCS